MNKTLKTIGLVFLIAITLFALVRLYYHLTDDFRLSNITTEMDYNADWALPPLSAPEHADLAHLLDQPFTYIGKGAQSYAFVSQDQQIVLKFFKFKHLKPAWYISALPSVYPFCEYKHAMATNKRTKLEGIFDGYAVAYRENKQTAGILYMQLVPGQNLHLQATLIDKLGFKHHVDLDKVVFIIQKKGETLRTRLNSQLKQNNIAGAKASIAQILDMYADEYRRGLYDRDHGVMHNTGFIGDVPFHLDVGKLTSDDRMREIEVSKNDLEPILWRLDKWIKETYPVYYPELSAYLSAQYKERTGATFDPTTIDAAVMKKKRHFYTRTKNQPKSE